MISASLRVASELSLGTLRQLATKQVDLIRVEGFYPADLCRRSAHKILEHPRLGHYKEQRAARRLGMGYVDVNRDTKAAQHYHSEAQDMIGVIRQVFYPYLSPIDHVRLLLEEQWPAGAGLERVDGHSCFVGTCRVFGSGVVLRPHTDRMDRLLPGGRQSGLSGQWTANVYLALPEQGGELELWMRDADEREARMIEARDGVDRENLEPPAIVLMPEVGDLILFDSEKLHSVSPGVGSDRVSMSTFIGYRSESLPLTYWS